MGFNKINSTFLLSFLALFTLLALSNAQNSAQDYVNCHNTPRGQVGVGPVIWNTTLANYAQNYANQRVGDCALTHSNGPYGENIAKGTSTFSGVAAVNLWVAEKSYYDYNTNTCSSGKVCGHYTQVVWRESVRIGCARVLCSGGLYYYVVCSYDPPGNWIGEWPY